MSLPVPISVPIQPLGRAPRDGAMGYGASHERAVTMVGSAGLVPTAASIHAGGSDGAFEKALRPRCSSPREGGEGSIGGEGGGGEGGGREGGGREGGGREGGGRGGGDRGSSGDAGGRGGDVV